MVFDYPLQIKMGSSRLTVEEHGSLRLVYIARKRRMRRLTFLRTD